MEKSVFISYSSRDRATVDSLISKLEAGGIDCWAAHKDIIPGSDWAESITHAIEDCKIFVIVFSQNSNNSVQVSKEINIAVSNNKIIIPYKIDSTIPEGSMNYYLCDTHWFDTTLSSMDEANEKFKDLISSMLDIAPAPTPESKSKVKPTPAKKRKQWLIISALIIAVIALAVTLFSRFSSDDPEPIPTPHFEQDLFMLDRYENTYFELGFILPSGWEFDKNTQVKENDKYIDVCRQKLFTIAQESTNGTSKYWRENISEMYISTKMIAKNSNQYGRVTFMHFNYANTQYDCNIEEGIYLGEGILYGYFLEKYPDHRTDNLVTKIGNETYHLDFYETDDFCTCIILVQKELNFELIIIDSTNKEEIIALTKQLYSTKSN